MGRSIAAVMVLAALAAAPLRAQGAADDAPAPVPEADGEPPAAPPELRADELRQLRLAKQPEPPHQGFLERLMIGATDSPPLPFLAFPFHDISFRPASQRAGGGLSLLTDYWNARRADDRFNVFGSAAWSLRGYQTYDLRLGRIPHAGDERPPETTQIEDLPPFAARLTDYGPGHHPRYVFLDLRARDLPREAFFGEGPESRRMDETSFQLRDLTVEIVGVSRLASPLSGAVRVGALASDVGPGHESGVPSTEQVFDEVDAPGLADPPRLLHAGAELLLDTRDEPRNAHGGTAVGLGAERYFDPDHAFSFSRLTLDARQAWSLGSPQRVLGLRAYSSLARADSGNRIPFYLQDTLGGGRTLRGYADFRFRGPAVVLLSAEYRWEAIPALELAVFDDAGTVGDRLSDLTHGPLHNSYGAGVRLKRPGAVLFRLDVARSPEQTRVLASTSFSF